MRQKNESIDSLLLEIRDVSQDFSQLYGKLIEYVYQIGDEVQRVISEIDSVIQVVFKDNEEVLENFINLSNKDFTSAFQLYKDDIETLTFHYNGAKKKIENLSRLGTIVSLMKETSVDMEIVSINTLTVAVRAGRVGGAFSYITNEIKKLTQIMSHQANVLDERSKLILYTLDLYSKKIEEIVSMERVLENFTHSILPLSLKEGKQRFQSVYSELEKISQDLKDTQDFIQGLVEKLQFQDTIAQALENMNSVIIKYIKEKEITLQDTSEEVLDYALFKDSLYKTCDTILGDIQVRSQENLKEFADLLNKFNDNLFSLQERKESIFRDLQSSGIFFQATESVLSYQKEMLKCYKTKFDFFKGSSASVRSIISLQHIFDNISQIVTRFENISIASKIEIAKQKGLKDMEGNINEMTLLIEKVSQELSEERLLVTYFIKSIEEVMATRAKDFQKYESSYKEFKDSSDLLLSQLQFYTEDINKKLLGFSVRSPILEESIINIKDRLSGIRGIVSHIEQARIINSGLSIVANEEFNRELREQGLQDWEFSSHVYSEAMNHFKIYSYKIAMKKSLGREQTSDSMDEGDVILF